MITTKIQTNKISPHPDNPRKELGDLEELTESIRAFGVLQNLTVIPNDEKMESFTVVCGHRRLAAAKAAGIEKVPVTIARNMDRKTQISIMLMENMQRSDLNPQEEAQGFQMMMDLGGSIEEIVEKTGFSETKVRHRMKLNELDQDTLSAKIKEGNISIGDLIKLEKIGTKDFDWTVESFVREEKKEGTIEALKRLLPDAEFTANWSQYPNVAVVSYGSDEDALQEFAKTALEHAEKLGGTIQIQTGYMELTARIKTPEGTKTNEVDEATLRKRQEMERRVKKLKSTRTRMMEAQRDFVRELPEAKVKEATRDIMDHITRAIMWGNAYEADPDDVLILLGEDEAKVMNAEAEDEEIMIEAAIGTHPYKAFMAAVFLDTMPGKWTTPWDFAQRYKGKDSMEVRKHRAIMDLLTKLGYKESTEERQLLDGTHEAYKREED